VGAGLIGFLVVLALVVAAVFLFRSMSRHLRKVPQSFDPPPARSDEPPPREQHDT
jgi:hypothetical protein